VKLRVRRLSPSAVLPSYAREGDAGLDLCVAGIERKTIDGWDAVSEWQTTGTGAYRYRTGVAVEIPDGYYGRLCGRSSSFARGLIIPTGTIDSGYRGELLVGGYVVSQFGLLEPVNIGDRIAQLVIAPVARVQVEEVAELSASERGVGGFGSTGR